MDPNGPKLVTVSICSTRYVGDVPADSMYPDKLESWEEQSMLSSIIYVITVTAFAFFNMVESAREVGNKVSELEARAGSSVPEMV
jgi:hypothetical protein